MFALRPVEANASFPRMKNRCAHRIALAHRYAAPGTAIQAVTNGCRVLRTLDLFPLPAAVPQGRGSYGSVDNFEFLGDCRKGLR